MLCKINKLFILKFELMHPTFTGRMYNRLFKFDYKKWIKNILIYCKIFSQSSKKIHDVSTSEN